MNFVKKTTANELITHTDVGKIINVPVSLSVT